jgi:hypothetical protein
MGSVSCLDPLAFLLASPQKVNPSMHSQAVGGGVVSALDSIPSVINKGIESYITYFK